MERLEIGNDGTFTLPGGSVMGFVRYLEGYGVRCEPTEMVASNRSHATVQQDHIHAPVDPERVQELYRSWMRGGGN
jgi:hypothetical protein